MLGVARGNGKSPLAAGLALRELVFADDEPDVILAAAARDQARVVFEYARGFVESGPLLDVLQVGRHEIRNRLNGGVLRTVSADGFVAHASTPRRLSSTSSTPGRRTSSTSSSTRSTRPCTSVRAPSGS
jgi:phage terminase large subunit-like protein